MASHWLRRIGYALLAATVLLVGFVAFSLVQRSQFSATTVASGRLKPTVVVIPTTGPPPITTTAAPIPTPWPTIILPYITPAPIHPEPESSDTIPTTAPEVLAMLSATVSPDQPMNAVLYTDRAANIAYTANVADIIVIGTVHVLPARWTTPGGARPANPHANANTDTIFTPVVIAVTQYLKGTGPLGKIHLAAYSGRVGADSLELANDDLYTFQTGEQVVVFLRNDRTIDSIPYYRILDRYTLQTDGKAVSSKLTMPLTTMIQTITQAGGDQ